MIELAGPAALAMIQAERRATQFDYEGVAAAMLGGPEVRLFAKPETLPGRRMGVALARGSSVEAAVEAATAAAALVRIVD